MKDNEIKFYKQKNDTFYSSTNGSISMEKDSNGNCMPNEMPNGGDYSDDFIR